MRFALLILLLAAGAYAHGEENIQAEPVTAVAFASIFLFIIMGLGLLGRKQIRGQGKKVIFLVVVIIVAATTAYVLAWTVSRNLESTTGGPVHWHADFEIWICGQKVQLPESEGFENKVGTALFHHHDDNRIHIEGVIDDLQEYDLGHFFGAIGGSFSKTSIIIPIDGRKTWTNGDECPDGRKGTLKMTVNGHEEQKMNEYIIAPYSDVPPGDFINITFS